MTVPWEATVVAASELASVDLEDEAAILNLKSGIYFGLNEVGARVWQLLQQPRTAGQVRDALLAEYDVAPERWEQDLQTLLQDLAAHDLIQIRPAPNTPPDAARA